MDQLVLGHLRLCVAGELGAAGEVSKSHSSKQ